MDPYQYTECCSSPCKGYHNWLNPLLLGCTWVTSNPPLFHPMGGPIPTTFCLCDCKDEFLQKQLLGPRLYIHLHLESTAHTLLTLYGRNLITNGTYNLIKCFRAVSAFFSEQSRFFAHFLLDSVLLIRSNHFWMSWISFFYLKFFFKDFIYLFSERGEGREKRGRETSMCGCLSRTLPQGTWPATQACALMGIKQATLWFAGWHSNHWATPARANFLIL